MRCLVVVTKDGCGACSSYHVATEKKLKDYIKKRGDLRYDNIECEKKMVVDGITIDNPGVRACTVGFDHETGQKKVIDMTYRLGAPFQGDYVFPSFVIYESDPALSSYPPHVVSVKKHGGKNAADLEAWIVSVMGESASALAALAPKADGYSTPSPSNSPVTVPPTPKKRSRRTRRSEYVDDVPSYSAAAPSTPSPISPTAPALYTPPTNEDDEHDAIPLLELETVAIIVSKGSIKKKKKSSDGLHFVEDVSKEDQYCTSSGKCLPRGYEIHPAPGPNGNLRVRRTKE